MRYSNEWYVKKAKELITRKDVQRMVELYLQGYKPKEISEKLKMPYGTVKSYLHILKKGGFISPVVDLEALEKRLKYILTKLEDMIINAKMYNKINIHDLEELLEELRYVVSYATSVKKAYLKFEMR